MHMEELYERDCVGVLFHLGGELVGTSLALVGPFVGLAAVGELLHARSIRLTSAEMVLLRSLSIVELVEQLLDTRASWWTVV